MSAFSKLLTGFSSLMLIGAIAAVPACGNDDGDDDGEGGAAGESSGGKGGASGSAGKGGAAGASGSAGKGGKGGSGGSSAAGAAGDDGAGGAPDSAGAGGGGGEPSSAGAGGSDTGEGGSGGAGEPGIATLKFCNNVTLQIGEGEEAEEQDVEFTIHVGTGSSRVTLKATSGTCAPVEGACPEIATGDAVEVEILDHEGDPFFGGSLEVLGGEQVVILADVDDEGEPDAIPYVLNEGEVCSEFVFDDL